VVYNSDLPNFTSEIFLISGLDIASENQNLFARQVISLLTAPAQTGCPRVAALGLLPDTSSIFP
jgi:hypothetical protein